MGRTKSVVPTHRLTILIPTTIFNDLKDLAQEEDTTVTEIVCGGLSRGVCILRHVNSGDKLAILQNGQVKPTSVFVIY